MNKIRTSFCVLLIICGTIPAFARHISYEDSLRKVIRRHPNDTDKVLLYEKLVLGNDRCGCNSDLSVDERLEYAAYMLDLAQRLKYKRGEAEAHRVIGLIYMYDDKKASIALRNFRAAAHIYKRIGDKHGLGGSMTNMSIVYIGQQEYKIAMDTLMIARQLLEEINDSLFLANTINAIGAVHFYKKEYDEAMQDYLKALTIYKQHNYKKSVTDNYYWLALLLFEQKQYDAALPYIEETLSSAKETAYTDAIDWAEELKAKIRRAKAKSRK